MKMFLLLIFSTQIWAKPYFDPKKVEAPSINMRESLVTFPIVRKKGSPVLRVEVTWTSNEQYAVTGLFLENSGTTALVARARNQDPLGSYKAQLVLPGQKILHASVGTGKEFRKLALTMSFRFPIPAKLDSAHFQLEAEHPEKGVMEKVLSQPLVLQEAKSVPAQNVNITFLRKAIKEPSIKVNFYAEGFPLNGEARFLVDAHRAIATFEQNLPGSEHFEFTAVFAVSKQKLGSYQDLGAKPVPRDSFLGLYFPHWHKFGRWYNVVYPTQQTKYRNALAQIAYDYPIALVDDVAYWGVGNYKELTAIPINNLQFSYLLLHEFGHFMGLNEEYEGGGPTELEFAPGIKEPWSQNITFAPEGERLKWYNHTEPGIGLPTSNSDYQRHGGNLKNPVGAYKGGYADSQPRGKSHKPVMKCMMGAGGDFCPVCSHALKELVEFDLGK